METLKAWQIFLTLLLAFAAVGFGDSETPAIQRSFNSFLIRPNTRSHSRDHKSEIQALGQQPITILANDTSYEQLMCIGFNPSLNLLSATIEIKLPEGFNGGLCTNGSMEYVRFWVSYDDSTWVGIGYVTVNTHDIANTIDCQKDPTKPLFYTLSTQFQPNQALCSLPILPKIRATLSWNELPPDDPSWSPVFGNTIENHIQSLPKSLAASDIYTSGMDTMPRRNVSGKTNRPSDKRAPGLLSTRRSIKDGFSLLWLRMSKIWKLDPKERDEESSSWLTQGSEESVQTSIWEEITCLGLDWGTSSLVATVHIKRPEGYHAPPCNDTRAEYVSFWADFNDTCKWTFLGTSHFTVHDYENRSPSGGLSYTAVMPVDVRNFSAPCNQTKIARVRAALAYNQVPPTPPAVAPRGNIIEAHVHLQPYIKPNNSNEPDIRYIGNVDVQNIDTVATGTGMTLKGIDVPVTFSGIADPWLIGTGLSRECPFGGWIIIRGDPVNGYSYRVMVRPFISPTDASLGVAVNAPINYDDPLAPLGTKTVYPNPEGWFLYFPNTENFENTIANWKPSHDGLWQVRVELGDSNFNSLSIYSEWYKVMVNNQGPTAQTVHVSLSNTGGPICGYWTVGDEITGTFDVDSSSPYFGAYSFDLSPAGFDPNPIILPNAAALGYPTTPVVPGNPEATWFLATTNSIPCGYVITLTGDDRTIVDSQAGYRFNYPAQIGFCLRPNSTAFQTVHDDL